MKKFDQLYMKKSSSLQIIYRANLEAIKYKDMSNPLLFFNEFEKTVCKLTEVGEPLSEIEKVRYMIRALPRSYAYVGDFIDLLPEQEDINVREIKDNTLGCRFEKRRRNRNIKLINYIYCWSFRLT